MKKGDIGKKALYGEIDTNVECNSDIKYFSLICCSRDIINFEEILQTHPKNLKTKKQVIEEIGLKISAQHY